jgi:hypothetical protein
VSLSLFFCCFSIVLASAEALAMVGTGSGEKMDRMVILGNKETVDNRGVRDVVMTEGVFLIVKGKIDIVNGEIFSLPYINKIEAAKNHQLLPCDSEININQSLWFFCHPRC